VPRLISELLLRCRARHDYRVARGTQLHAGASLIAPHVRFNDVHVYIEDDLQAWVGALDLHTVEFGGNVHLLRPYDEGVFSRMRNLEGIATVGNIQLYLDLYHYPARGRKQAEFLPDKKIAF
jgi:hypothetical protein